MEQFGAFSGAFSSHQFEAAGAQLRALRLRRRGLVADLHGAFADELLLLKPRHYLGVVEDPLNLK